MKTTQPDIDTLHARLDTLRLPFIREHCGPRTTEAAKKSLTHLGYLAAALGHAACQLGMRVLFANAIDVINTLSTA